MAGCCVGAVEQDDTSENEPGHDTSSVKNLDAE